MSGQALTMPLSEKVAAQAAGRSRFGLLVRVKRQSLYNMIVQTTSEAPVRVSVAFLLIVLIWLGLYFMFKLVLKQFEDSSPLETTVAIPMVFNFFFVAMMVMLTFSNAIISHGSLFARREAEYLLSSPFRPIDLVSLKYLESLGVSSWSLVLLGLPLMLAMAEKTHSAWFYPLFIAFFLAFIPIPGAIGMVIAWAAAHFFPRRVLRTLVAIGSVAIMVLLVVGVQAFRVPDSGADVWLRQFLARMSFIELSYLPNRWAADGIDHALNGQFDQSVQYLAVTAVNAVFFSWLGILVVARFFNRAYDRATSGRGSGIRKAASASGGLCGWAFFYLPMRLRLIAAKDLRMFFRDPTQWGQLVILFGLIVLYLTNLSKLPAGLNQMRLMSVIPFLNMCAISLILATFTCRFVFPLVSLEGQQLWMIGLLPLRRGRILWAKFMFAMTVSLTLTVGSTLLAVRMIDLEIIWAIIHVITTISICFGLCGLAVGLGARMPMFDQPNAARIANGLGGTANLLASLAMVTVVLAAIGVAVYRGGTGAAGEEGLDLTSFGLCLGAWLVAFASGIIALAVGARHFSRVEA